jgi:hypothetical protein
VCGRGEGPEGGGGGGGGRRGAAAAGVDDDDDDDDDGRRGPSSPFRLFCPFFSPKFIFSRPVSRSVTRSSSVSVYAPDLSPRSISLSPLPLSLSPRSACSQRAWAPTTSPAASSWTSWDRNDVSRSTQIPWSSGHRRVTNPYAAPPDPKWTWGRLGKTCNAAKRKGDDVRLVDVIRTDVEEGEIEGGPAVRDANREGAWSSPPVAALLPPPRSIPPPRPPPPPR